jgi:hypothetical protein
LHGHYPHAEYPVGAVLLFAFEAWISGGATRVANAFTMVPFTALTVAGVWLFRTPTARWLAAFVGLFPFNPYYWEFKFDIVPAALLVVGLLFAYRSRWAISGVLLGLGTLVKWTPGLAFVAVAAWLVASRDVRAALRHAVAFVATVAIVYVPFAWWDADGVFAAYTRQRARVITAESLWYLPLHAIGQAHVGTHISFGAHAPQWANRLATALQLTLVLIVIALAARARTRETAIALAALVPVTFLLTNRIFSPQFILVLVAGWSVAGALLVRDRVAQLALGVVAGAASVANAFVYPYALPHYTFTWRLASLTLFACGLAATAWLVALGARGDVVLSAERQAGEAELEPSQPT